MVEVIIVVAHPETDEENAYTQVHRFEFEEEQVVEASLGWLRHHALSGGKMINSD